MFQIEHMFSLKKVISSWLWDNCGRWTNFVPEWPKSTKLDRSKAENYLFFLSICLHFETFLVFSLGRESLRDFWSFSLRKIKEYGKGNSVGLRLLSIDLAIGHLKSFLVYLANINEKRTKRMSNQMSEKESMSHRNE